jgi:hypothetical protein
MRVFRSLIVLLVVLAITGAAETSLQQRSGGAGQRGVGAGGQRGTPPPGGRRGLPPDGQRRGGRGASANVARIEARTYIFPETGEEIEYDIFVSTKVDKKKKSPLVIALHGLGVPPAQWLRLIVDAAQDAGYIVAAPMGYNVHGWYGANGPTSGQAEIPSLGELSEQSWSSSGRISTSTSAASTFSDNRWAAPARSSSASNTRTSGRRSAPRRRPCGSAGTRRRISSRHQQCR